MMLLYEFLGSQHYLVDEHDSRNMNIQEKKKKQRNVNIHKICPKVILP